MFVSAVDTPQRQNAELYKALFLGYVHGILVENQGILMVDDG